MDETQFDELTQRLRAAASRRRLLGGALSGAAILSGAAVAQLDDVVAKKGGKGKGKKKGHGKGKGKGKTKVFICHHTDEDSVELIRVGAPAVKGHTKHGDTVCGEPGVCQTGSPTGCDQTTGACTFALAAEGTECTAEGEVPGTCDATGACVAL